MEFCGTASDVSKPHSGLHRFRYAPVQTLWPRLVTLKRAFMPMHTIAIIEDAEDNRDLLYYLVRDEFRVMRFKSGEEALRKFAFVAPDLIVMDIKLPGLDGIEVLREIRNTERLGNVPVLAFTANAMTGDREKYLAAGFNEYAPKPIVDIDTFVATVRRLVQPKQPD